MNALLSPRDEDSNANSKPALGSRFEKPEIGFINRISKNARAMIAAIMLASAVAPTTQGCSPGEIIDPIVNPIKDAGRYVTDKVSEAWDSIGQFGRELVTIGDPITADLIENWASQPDPKSREAKLIKDIYHKHVVPALRELEANESYKDATSEIQKLLKELVTVAVVTTYVNRAYANTKSDRKQEEADLDSVKRDHNNNLNIDKLEREINEYNDRIEDLETQRSEAKDKAAKKGFKIAIDKMKENRRNLKSQLKWENAPYHDATSDKSEQERDKVLYEEMFFSGILGRLKEALGDTQNRYKVSAAFHKREYQREMDER